MTPYTRTTDVLLSLEHVSLSFGERCVLRDVSAVVTDVVRPDQAQGQVICFLGPSGIGKSTLSRVIAGLQAPTSGAVTIRGRDGQMAPTHRGAVGMVPQDYPLFKWATVAKNLAIAGRQAGLDAAAINAKAAPYIEALWLDGCLQQYPHQLSGGTRQRVAIVRQLLCAEHYLVMDEPFSGLDPIMKAQAAKLVTTLAQLDSLTTVIVVTHDIDTGLAVSDTVWLMGLESGHPGARLVETHDLAALGFAWRPDIQDDPQFGAFVRDIKKRFHTLK